MGQSFSAGLSDAASVERLLERRARYRRGHWAEFLASLALMLKGYQILARRYKSRSGEIDLIAIRGGKLAFVEVKRRPTLRDAQASITPKQSLRLRRAAAQWLAQRPRFSQFDQRFDAVFVTPGAWPAHVTGGA